MVVQVWECVGHFCWSVSKHVSTIVRVGVPNLDSYLCFDFFSWLEESDSIHLFCKFLVSTCLFLHWNIGFNQKVWVVYEFYEAVPKRNEDTKAFESRYRPRFSACARWGPLGFTALTFFLVPSGGQREQLVAGGWLKHLVVSALIFASRLGAKLKYVRPSTWRHQTSDLPKIFPFQDLPNIFPISDPWHPMTSHDFQLWVQLQPSQAVRVVSLARLFGICPCLPLGKMYVGIRCHKKVPSVIKHSNWTGFDKWRIMEV